MKKHLLSLTMVILCLSLQTLSKGVTIDTTATIQIGGIKQVISIKGKDSAKPILLYLHGSGSNSYSIISNAAKLTSKLQEQFVVVLWDQREYGKTYELNKTQKKINLQLMVADTKEVIDFVLKKFKRKKIYLVGHSMGSMYGVHIANKHPQLLHALVAMSPPVNKVESDKIALEMLKKHFKKLNNQRAISELATIESPTTDFQQQFIQYVWQTEYDGEHVTDEMRKQGKPILKKMAETFATLLVDMYAQNFFTQFPTLSCPVYFFTGRQDFSTNSKLTHAYYEQLNAPKKDFFWFEKSAHGLPDAQPDLMQKIIIDKVLSKN